METAIWQATYPELVAAFKYFVYLPACLACAWLLLPRLQPFPRRVAGGMLLIKLLLLLMALELASERSYVGFVWNFDLEHNIPSQLGASLMSLAGAAALLAAWHSRLQPKRLLAQRAAVGLLLLLLAVDDYYYPLKSLFRFVFDNYYQEFYGLVGIVIGLMTALEWARGARNLRLWHACLLVGLVLIGAGGVLLDGAGVFCGIPNLVEIVGNCRHPINIEEVAEQMGSWLALTAALGYLGAAAPTLSLRLRRALVALPLLWFPVILLVAQAPRQQLAQASQRANVRFGDSILLEGYDITVSAESSDLRLYLSASQAEYSTLSDIFISTIESANGVSRYTQKKLVANEQGVWFLGAGQRLIYRQQMRVHQPQGLPPNRAQWLALSIANRSGLLHIADSDRRLLGDNHVVLTEYILPSPAAAPAATAPIARFDGRFALVDVSLPERARAGDTLDIPMSWRSDADASSDYTQFLHFVHAESGAQWGHDQLPLGARLPMRLWYAGLQDTETWHAPLPADLAPGRYDVYTGLYRLDNMQRLPATNPDGSPAPDNRPRVGSLIIESSSP